MYISKSSIFDAIELMTWQTIYLNSVLDVKVLEWSLQIHECKFIIEVADSARHLTSVNIDDINYKSIRIDSIHKWLTLDFLEIFKSLLHIIVIQELKEYAK